MNDSLKNYETSSGLISIESFVKICSLYTRNIGRNVQKGSADSTGLVTPLRLNGPCISTVLSNVSFLRERISLPYRDACVFQ
jgi:hypothetical protein